MNPPPVQCIEYDMKDVTPDTTIEEIVERIPDAVPYLMRQGIQCIRCGEPVWQTLEEAARQKGFSEEDIQRFVHDLRLLRKRSE